MTALPVIGLVGGDGYIGSALVSQLTTCQLIKLSRDDPYRDLASFRAIIYLAGKADRYLAEKDIDANVTPIVDLAQRMRPDQILIYASTTAVYENLVDADESTIIDSSSLNPYCRSMLLREQQLQQLPIISVGLRLATVVGLAPKQRSDRIHIQMLKSALFTGVVRVTDPFSKRPIVSVQETVEAFQRLINNLDRLSGHTLYNISSFNTTVLAVSSSIALKTQARVSYQPSHNLKGFSVNNQNFVQQYGMVYTSTNDSIVADLWDHKDQLLESWANPVHTLTCLICQTPRMTQLIDLGTQPLANQLTPKEAELEAYPLAMYRCTNCYHNQLNHIVPPEKLFTNYLYVSGTAQTNDQHFDHFAEQITSKRAPGKVLDIACNDGTQLDKFKSRGWETYGVDPAHNLAPLSRAKGHAITVGFWGDPEIEQSLPSVFDVIIAQNVVAHVPDPCRFVLGCRNKMNESSRLYLQTSQAELFNSGEFDTLYHEHVSFFTVRSMAQLAHQCQLHLDHVEKVPIHGVSYIFTLRLGPGDINAQVQSMMEAESHIYSPYNSIFYRHHVNERRFLISQMMKRCVQDGFKLVGFGAPAKGNTLLNSLDGVMPEYLVDENALKQGLFSPGHRIPIVPYDRLVDDDRSLAIIVLAWNFLDEIKTKIAKARGSRPTIILVPFPDTDVLVLREGVWVKMSSFPLRISLTPQPKVTKLLITHFYNEEFMLPYWIMHHAPLFDKVILIDHHSDDRSCQIIKELAPSSWEIRPTALANFDAVLTDYEVRKIEQSYPDEVWKIALTVTEFLIWPDCDAALLEASSNCFRVCSHNIIGDDSIPLRPDLLLIEQRNRFTTAGFDYSRFIHRNHNHQTQLYTAGRHSVHTPSKPAPGAMIFKYLFSPWPECLPRKLQIGARQSKGDIAVGAGSHHQMKKEEMERKYQEFLRSIQPDFYKRSMLGSDLDLTRSRIVHHMLYVPWSNLA